MERESRNVAPVPGPMGRAPAWRRAQRWLRPLLWPLSLGYGLGTRVRRRWLERKARRLPCPVVSVGNITCGGTGKTPMVERVVRDLAERGWRAAIVSRGYRSRRPRGGGSARADGGGNDELELLRENLPDVPHFQSARRWEAGREAVAAGADVVVLDDGFQHARLARDLEIVLLDALDPFGPGGVLPAGLLREPLGALRRADLLAISRCNLADRGAVEAIEQRLEAVAPGVKVIRLRSDIRGWFDPAGQPREAPRRSGYAFCGIGQPESFRRQLLALGLELQGWRTFPDHHEYRARDVEGIVGAARRARAETILTTQKDMVKLSGYRPVREGRPVPWRVPRISVGITRGAAEYRRRIDALGGGARGR